MSKIIYQLYKDGMIIKYEANSITYISDNDEEYNKWLEDGNTPIAKGIKVISEIEQRVNELELYILTQEGLI